MKNTIVPLKKRRMTLSFIILSSRLNELELNQDTLATNFNNLYKGRSIKEVPKYGILRRFLFASYRDIVRFLRWLI
jgi:hypothetical protein